MATPPSLLKLIEDGVIDQVLQPLKNGKEADLFVVIKDNAAYAAKVYRKREHRSFKNNATYRDGRSVRNTRSTRAMEKGTRFGKQVLESAWQKAEADALRQLFSVGVRVPQVLAHYEDVLVMELILDATGEPAPQLAQVQFTPQEAEAIYDELVGQVVLMLLNDMVHGDFSPYNVLVSAYGPVVIDLPQVVSASHNLKACVLVERDVQSVARYLGIFSPTVRRLAREAWQIWHEHEKGTLVPEFRPALPPEPPPPDPAVLAARRAAADAGPGEVMDLVREARRELDGFRGCGAARARPPTTAPRAATTAPRPTAPAPRRPPAGRPRRPAPRRPPPGRPRPAPRRLPQGRPRSRAATTAPRPIAPPLCRDDRPSADRAPRRDDRPQGDRVRPAPRRLPAGRLRPRAGDDCPQGESAPAPRRSSAMSARGPRRDRPPIG
ncbi:MAG: hypothetical protein KF878_31245 [Planctomycetes bacterium]|nr:hypothetical protein [Planctomycetota bacterium]